MSRRSLRIDAIIPAKHSPAVRPDPPILQRGRNMGHRAAIYTARVRPKSKTAEDEYLRLGDIDDQ